MRRGEGPEAVNHAHSVPESFTIHRAGGLIGARQGADSQMRSPRITVVTAAVVASALALPAVSGAATSTNRFSFTVKEAKLAVANLQPIALDPSQIPGGTGLPTISPISLTGTVSDSGSIAVPKEGASFPAIDMPVPQQLIDQLAGLAGSAGSLPNIGGFDIGALLKSGSISVNIKAAITASGPITGTVDRDTGAVTLKAPLQIGVGIKATVFKLIPLELINCSLSGLTFNMTSAGAAMPTGTQLPGAAYSSSAKTATVAGVAEVSAPKCTGLAASLLGSALDGLGTSLGQVGLSLNGDVVLPPPAVVTLTTTKTVMISTSGKVTTKVSCSKARSCKGTVAVAQPGGAVIASRSYTLSAGRSATVTITLPKSAKTLMKTTPKMDAVFRVSVAAGSALAKPISLQRPLNWR